MSTTSYISLHDLIEKYLAVGDINYNQCITAGIYPIWLEEKQCRVGFRLRFHWTNYRAKCIQPHTRDIWGRSLLWWQIRHCWVQWFQCVRIIWYLLQPPTSTRVASVSEAISARRYWCFLIGINIQKLHLGSSWIACEPWQWRASMPCCSRSLQLCPWRLSYNYWRGMTVLNYFHKSALLSKSPSLPMRVI